MCCAQTAAPEGKKHMRWEMEKRGHRSIKSSTQRSARSVVGSVASKHSGKLSDMLLHETAVAWLRWKLQPSTPACLWEETREEHKRRMQEACRQVCRLQQTLQNPGQRLHEPSEIEVQRLPKPFKMRPGGAHEGQDAAKRHPRASKTRSAGVQERPRTTLLGPTSAPKSPKSAPRAHKCVPKALQ